MSKRPARRPRVDYRETGNVSEESEDEVMGDDDDLDNNPVEDAASVDIESESDDGETIDLASLPVAPLVPKSAILGYFSKDGNTFWSSVVPASTRTRTHNLVTASNPGPRGEAENPEASPAEIMKLFLTPEAVKLILDYTNKFAMEHFEEQQLARPWKIMDEVELYSYVGLMLLIGRNKARHQPVHVFWSTSRQNFHPEFIATMSRKRFDDINRFLRFDDVFMRKAAKEAGEDVSRSAPISEYFELILKNIEQLYEPHIFLCVDEIVVPFRGRCPFRVYMKNKSAKYGIKLWAIVDQHSGYLLKFQLYEGKVGNVAEVQQGKRVVLDLTKRFFGSGRNVTADNFFTSKELILELLSQNLTYVGTLRKGKKEVPPALLTTKDKNKFSSVFGFCDDITIVSYVNRHKKPILLLSSMHHDTEISNNPEHKPEIVDTVDQMTETYSCQRATRRWPSKLFFHSLDVMAKNSFIIWKTHHAMPGQNTNTWRRKLLLDLSLELISPQMQRRATQAVLKTHLRDALGIMGIEIPMTPHVPPISGRQKCHQCKKTSRTTCVECHQFICADHQVKNILCQPCNNK